MTSPRTKCLHGPGVVCLWCPPADDGGRKRRKTKRLVQRRRTQTPQPKEH